MLRTYKFQLPIFIIHHRNICAFWRFYKRKRYKKLITCVFKVTDNSKLGTRQKHVLGEVMHIEKMSLTVNIKLIIFTTSIMSLTSRIFQ